MKVTITDHTESGAGFTVYIEEHGPGRTRYVEVQSWPTKALASQHARIIRKALRWGPVFIADSNRNAEHT